jgi:ribosomal protein S27E
MFSHNHRLYGDFMARWMLICRHCQCSFQQSEIAVRKISDYFEPTKPELPKYGAELKCPHCGHKTIYFTTDLMYAAGKAANG